MDSTNGSLNEIIPLCSYCKSIRNKKGDWERIEAFISKRCDAQVSHGICPECMKELHPNIYK